MNRKPFVIHPFMFAIYPVFVLFYYNIGYSSFSDTLLPLSVVVGFTVLFLFISRLIKKDKHKAGIVLSVFLLLFFLYGHVSAFIRKRGIIEGTLIRDLFLILLFFILMTSAVYFIRKTKSDLYNLTTILNFTAIILVAISVFRISVYTLKTTKIRPSTKSIISTDNGDAKVTGSGKRAALPDIYYFIFDRYGGESALKEYYNFDNTEFTSFLKSRGFFVANKSNSNYHRTTPSLASSLNMEYINHLSETLGEDSVDWRPLYGMIQDHKVWRFLKSKGYTYIHFGSGFKATEVNIYAHKNYNLHSLPEFTRVLYMTTMLYSIGGHLNFVNFRKEKRKRILYELEMLGEIPYLDEPTFVFAHLVLPHAPAVFDRDGNYRSAEEERKKSYSDNYIDQLVFLNKKIKELVDKLLSRSKIKPIIILQSDEGPVMEKFIQDYAHFNWEKASADEIKMKMSILNAYYLPNIDKSVLYPSITPVNTFRLIFNSYFDANYQLLPDENYTFLDEYHKYKFINVTDILSQ